MSSSQEQIKHLAKLARLGLGQDEIVKFSQEFKKILAYVQKLETVKVTGVKETNQVTGLINIYKADRIKEEIPAAEILKTAPAVQAKQIKVKSVFGEDR